METKADGSDNGQYYAHELVVFPADERALEPGHEDSPRWTEAAEAYLASALDSSNTRRAYRRHLASAGRLFEDPSMAALSGMDLARYRQSTLESGLAPNSEAQALSAVRSFLTWYASMFAFPLPIAAIKVALKAPRADVRTRYTVVTEREIERLFDAVDTSRDRAILATLLGSGLRVSEVSSLDLGDLTYGIEDGMILVVRSGKGRKSRAVPVRDEVEKAICDYVASTGRYLNEDGPLFLAEDRGAQRRGDRRLSSRAISKLVKRWAAAAGISAKRVTGHAMRHSYATRCIKSGGSVVAVSKLLGHSNVATTNRYIDHFEIDDLRKAVPALPLHLSLTDTEKTDDD